MWRDGFLVWRTGGEGGAGGREERSDDHGGEGGAGGREERSDEKKLPSILCLTMLFTMLNYSHQDGLSGLLPLTAPFDLSCRYKRIYNDVSPQLMKLV